MIDALSEQDFDEEQYIRAYPDVAQAVASGLFASGRDHFTSHGRQEGRVGRPGLPSTSAPRTANAFDEAWYLENNPDVAEAVRAGRLRSGHDHWAESGRAEGRIAPPGYEEGDAFDAAWYLASYHVVPDEIDRGRARDAAHHYETLGRFRGYLPNRYAPRPDNPAGVESRFGGLWLDQANALDLIDGRLEIGRLTPAQAEMLRHWVTDGFVILRQALPAELVDAAAHELRRAYAGEIDALKFECPSVGGYRPMNWDQAVQTSPAKALDLHWLSQTIRDLIFAAPIREFLEIAFERRALATQSLTFLRGSAQGYHQDTLYVPYSLPRQFVASWIALEDVAPGGGELTYFPGSHRLPEYLYGGQFKTLWDAQRILRRSTLREETKDYSSQLEKKCRDAGLSPMSFMARKGDVLLWHADLSHGGLPIAQDKTRASVVTHYCPKEVAALTFERGRTAMRPHGDVAWYATGIYAGE